MALGEQLMSNTFIKVKQFGRPDGSVILSVWFRDENGALRVRMAQCARSAVRAHLNYLATFGEWPNENGEATHDIDGLPF